MKFFFGFLAIIAAIVVVILLSVSLFRGFDNSNNPSTFDSTYDLKSVAATDTVARHIVSGAIISNENYHEIHITISKNARTIEIIRGYSGAVEKTSTLPNTSAAYDAFLGALHAAEFSNKANVTNGDPRSTCVSGNRYYYQLQEGSEKKVDTWTTSCSARQGNFVGNINATAQLFRNQIPNYGEFVSGVNLNFY